MKHLGVFEHISGMMMGRFCSGSEALLSDVKNLIEEVTKLKSFPILINVDCGHTDPVLTFPVGYKITINAEKQQIEVFGSPVESQFD